VTGGGPIGCLIVMAARLAGAAHVVVTDVVDRPLATAKAVGADRCVRVDQIPSGPEAVAEVLGEMDVALEAAGNSAALATCLAAVNRGGRIVQVGTLPAEELKFPANQIMVREIDYVGTFRFGIEFEWAVQYLIGRRWTYSHSCRPNIHCRRRKPPSGSRATRVGASRCRWLPRKSWKLDPHAAAPRERSNAADWPFFSSLLRPGRRQIIKECSPSWTTWFR